MKAIVKVAPGWGNVELCEVQTPQPSAGQVRIRVRAAGLCGTDLHIYRDEFRSLPPVVLGHELAGEIDMLGEGVTTLPLGARVTSETYFSVCGRCRSCRAGHTNLCLERRSIGSAVNGGFAENVVVPAANIHLLPDAIGFQAGALTEPLACVVHAVCTTPSVCPGDVAVIAGPGPIGLLTLQVVRAAGARAIVLGTTADSVRLAKAKELGADAVIDVESAPTQSIQSTVLGLTSDGLGADVVYECAGAGSAAQMLLQLVRRRGRYVQIGIFGKPVTWDADQIVYRELLVSGTNASTPPAWLAALDLLRSGQVRTQPLISDILPLEAWESAFCGGAESNRIKVVFDPTL
jgi:L-iditol 2-dehydrogenase